MIGYRYNQQIEPPAPFVHVTIRPPHGSTAVVDVPALLDTAADISVIPASIAETLGLVPLGEVPIGGFDGRVTRVLTYLVEAAMRQFEPRVIRVVASRDEPYALLGRDFLNAYRILLDGPQSRLEIG